MAEVSVIIREINTFENDFIVLNEDNNFIYFQETFFGLSLLPIRLCSS